MPTPPHYRVPRVNSELPQSSAPAATLTPRAHQPTGLHSAARWGHGLPLTPAPPRQPTAGVLSPCYVLGPVLGSQCPQHILELSRKAASLALLRPGTLPHGAASVTSHPPENPWSAVTCSNKSTLLPPQTILAGERGSAANSRLTRARPGQKVKGMSSALCSHVTTTRRWPDFLFLVTWGFLGKADDGRRGSKGLDNSVPSSSD